MAIPKSIQTVGISTFCVYLFTSIHHFYGAWLYETPWRNHIALQGGMWLVVCFFLLWIYGQWKQKIIAWLFLLLAGFFFVGAIGIYEGGYNHVLKNLLYFGGLSKVELLTFYYPPLYELPNDFLFEFSGILTFGLALYNAWTMWQFIQQEKLLPSNIKARLLNYKLFYLGILLTGILFWQQLKSPFGWKFQISSILFFTSITALLGMFSWSLIKHHPQFLNKLVGGFMGIVALLLFIGSTLFSINPKYLLGKSKELTIEEWTADLHQLADLMQNQHIDFEKVFPKAAFDKTVNTIELKLPQLSSTQIPAEFVKLVGATEVSHSIISPFQPALNFSVFPLGAYFFDDGLFVTKAATSYQTTIGTKIIKINQTPIEKVYRKFKRIIAAESETMHRYLFPLYVFIPELLENEGIITSTKIAQFTFQRADNTTFTLNLHPESLLLWGAWYMHLIKGNPREKTPVRFQFRPENYWQEYWAEDQTLYIQYNVCENKGGESMAAFAKKMEVLMAEKKVQKLVLDVRNNTGGNNSTNLPLLQFIHATPTFHKKGNLLVLASGKTASAATNLITELRNTTAMILLGESPAHGYNMYGDKRTFTLKHSGITVDLATRFWGGGWAGDTSRQIPLDIPVAFNGADFFNDRDPVLERARNLEKIATVPSCPLDLEGQFLLSPYQIVDIQKKKEGLQMEIHDFTRTGLFKNSNYLTGRSLFYVHTPLYCNNDSLFTTNNPSIRLALNSDSLMLLWMEKSLYLPPVPKGYLFPMKQLAAGELTNLEALVTKNRERQPPNLEAIINGLGYHFMNQKEYEQAAKIFNLNIQLFPQSFNVYDSYGECLLLLNRKKEAKEYYEKALALNPNSQRIIDIIKQL